ncbi:Protein of unknown function DUF3342 [Carpediemonas membranifera]|uniref:SANT and BTB domain-containing protein n=1 Tax=Carpediemonas membranifera TaxID=201153 RepID=A0A8J6E1D2_9EUKA|nr:Protein of unknown function DUF3342 [Carpediemonas membranifera]|eukprot:KAG9393323.1 Protein of unknown function DUF3342 [Carpediemonas membranifera]
MEPKPPPFAKPVCLGNRTNDIRLVNAVKKTEVLRRTERIDDGFFWLNVASLVPGMNPRECALRYESLYKSSVAQKLYRDSKLSPRTMIERKGPFDNLLQTSQLKCSLDVRPPPQKPMGVENILRQGTLDSDDAEDVQSPTGALLPPKPVPPDSPKTVLIRVHDGPNERDKEFILPQDIVVEKMGYFAKVLATSRASTFADMEITVQCDVDIFERLVDFSLGGDPRLDPRTILSVVISAEFLKTRSLVDQCIEFIAAHLQQVIDQPLSMSCLSAVMVAKLARAVTPEALAEVEDPKGKIVDRVFKAHLDAFMKKRTFQRCCHCGDVYPADRRDKYRCERSKIYIDFHGDLRSSHVADSSFKQGTWIGSLKRSLGTWQAVYWRVWAHTRELVCITCDTAFPAAHFDRCSFHPSKPQFRPGFDVGIYPCCRNSAFKYGTETDGGTSGCQMKDHVVTPITAISKETVRLLEKHRDVCLAPRPVPVVVDTEPSATDSTVDTDTVKSDADADTELIPTPRGGFLPASTIWQSKSFKLVATDGKSRAKRRQQIIDLVHHREVGVMQAMVQSLRLGRGGSGKGGRR